VCLKNQDRTAIGWISIPINASNNVLPPGRDLLATAWYAQLGKPLFKLVGDGVLEVLIPAHIASHGIDAGNSNQLLEYFDDFP
jgi:hypothetical protein